MDLSRIKSTKEKITIIQQEKYADTPVLTLLAHSQDKRHSLSLNRKAFEVMGIDGENNQLVMFENYDTSLTETPDYNLVLGVTSDAIIKADKQYKTSNIHLSTRTVKSKDIHTTLCTLFDLDSSIDNELVINQVEGLNGVYTLNVMSQSQKDEVVEVEVELNRGENITISEQ